MSGKHIAVRCRVLSCRVMSCVFLECELKRAWFFFFAVLSTDFGLVHMGT